MSVATPDRGPRPDRGLVVAYESDRRTSGLNRWRPGSRSRSRTPVAPPTRATNDQPCRLAVRPEDRRPAQPPIHSGDRRPSAAGLRRRNSLSLIELGNYRVDGGAHRAKKNTWGSLTGSWVPHDVRDEVVDFARRWSEKTEIGVGRFIHWLGVTASKFYDWRERYGCVNEQNGWVPRDFWLEPWEKDAIIDFHLKNPLEGYRRLTFMMLDANVGGGQSGERVAGVEASWAAVAGESQTVAQGDRFRATAAAASALAYRRFLHQPVRHLLLLVQRSGWVQSFHRALGFARVDEGERHRGNSGARQGKVPGGKAAYHLGQQATVHGTRFQGVHSNLRHDECANFTLLSPIERQNRALAQVTKERVHPAWNTAFAG